jgi:two-component system cell cycle response regulator DivK
VLLVQPHDDTRQMYAEFLLHHGFSVFERANGDDALKVAPLADVIVTGIRLNGGIDGVELVARVRDDDRTKRTPIIVLTASVTADERSRAKQAGCDVFLPKPCLPVELLREVRRVLFRQIRGRPARLSARLDDNRKRRRR